MGVFSIFGTSGRALNAYSGALSVVANNVANAGNENYSRQRVSFSTLSPDRVGGIETGRGLFLSGVNQVVNTFTENRLTEGLQSFGESNARFEFLQSTDAIFSEFDGSGLNTSLGGFFDSWTALAAEPESITARNNVLASADSMTSIFNRYAEALDTIQQTVDSEINYIVPLVNDVLTKIKDLNERIQQSESGALNFRDERRKAVNELASYVDINVVESNSALQIYTKAGTPLLNGLAQATLSTQPNGATNLLDVIYTLGGTQATITNTLQSGRLTGLIDVRDNYIEGYKSSLDEMAYAMTTQVNALQSTGFDLDGNTGNNFFTVLGSSTDAAAQISLSADVNGLPRAIGSSDDVTEVPGNNVVALAIASLADSNTIDFDSGAGVDNNSFVGHFGDLLASIGSDGLIIESTKDFDENILDQVKLERSQASGVNMDEEEINLIKFQAAFQASMRLVKVADEILKSLIDILG